MHKMHSSLGQAVLRGFLDCDIYQYIIALYLDVRCSGVHLMDSDAGSAVESFSMNRPKTAAVGQE